MHAVSTISAPTFSAGSRTVHKKEYMVLRGKVHPFAAQHILRCHASYQICAWFLGEVSRTRSSRHICSRTIQCQMHPMNANEPGKQHTAGSTIDATLKQPHQPGSYWTGSPLLALRTKIICLALMSIHQQYLCQATKCR
jgi:hypothetical protein